MAGLNIFYFFFHFFFFLFFFFLTIIYIYIFLKGLKGGGGKDKKSKMIKEVKMSTPIETLCEGQPAVFKDFLVHHISLIL